MTLQVRFIDDRKVSGYLSRIFSEHDTEEVFFQITPRGAIATDRPLHRDHYERATLKVLALRNAGHVIPKVTYGGTNYDRDCPIEKGLSVPITKVIGQGLDAAPCDKGHKSQYDELTMLTPNPNMESLIDPVTRIFLVLNGATNVSRQTVPPVTHQAASRWLREKRIPILHWRVLCELVGIPVEDLIQHEVRLYEQQLRSRLREIDGA